MRCHEVRANRVKTSKPKMQSTSSQIVLSELSRELQKKINDLTFANYRCEKILRYLKLCQIENADKALNVSEASRIDGLQRLDDLFSFAVPPQSDCGPIPMSTVPDKYEPTSLSREDESTSGLTSISLEDVLNLARETRVRGTRIKSANTVETVNLNRNIDDKLSRYPFLV